MTVELVLYSRAQQALAEARTIDEVKDIRDKAVAMQVYAKQAMDPELVNNAIDIRCRAERRAGEMLRQLGERRGKTRTSDSGSLPSNKELGVTDKQSAAWQRVAALAQEDYEARVRELQQAALHARPTHQEKQARRAQHEKDLGDQIRALPLKQFGVILADPEWKFLVWDEATGSDRSAANHYATSALEQIKARDVPSIAADDCVLFLWATVPMLPQALEVMKAWGFDYRSHVVWLKDRIGTGYWFRNAHELLLLGVKGDVPAPAPGMQWESAFEADVREHSQKPKEVYDLVERYFPTLPKIELNARPNPDRPEGWEVWGAEAPVDVDDPQPQA